MIVFLFHTNEFMSQKRVLIKVLAPLGAQELATTRRQLKLFPATAGRVVCTHCSLRI